MVPAPAGPPALTLAMIRAAAKRCVLSYQSMHPATVLDALNSEQQAKFTEADLWQVIALQVTDERERQVLAWQAQRKRGELVWSQGREIATLNALWRRWVEDPIGRISEQERDAYQREEWARLARNTRSQT